MKFEKISNGKFGLFSKLRINGAGLYGGTLFVMSSKQNQIGQWIMMLQKKQVLKEIPHGMVQGMG